MPYHTAAECLIQGLPDICIFNLSYFISMYFFLDIFLQRKQYGVFSATQLCEQYQLNYSEIQLRITGNLLVSINTISK